MNSNRTFMELKFFSRGSVRYAIPTLQSHLYGIEIKLMFDIIGDKLSLQSHLYGIEIAPASTKWGANLYSNRTFMELK